MFYVPDIFCDCQLCLSRRYYIEKNNVILRIYIIQNSINRSRLKICNKSLIFYPICIKLTTQMMQNIFLRYITLNNSKFVKNNVPFFYFKVLNSKYLLFMIRYLHDITLNLFFFHSIYLCICNFNCYKIVVYSTRCNKHKNQYTKCRSKHLL